MACGEQLRGSLLHQAPPQCPIELSKIRFKILISTINLHPFIISASFSGVRFVAELSADQKVFDSNPDLAKVFVSRFSTSVGSAVCIRLKLGTNL